MATYTGVSGVGFESSDSGVVAVNPSGSAHSLNPFMQTREGVAFGGMEMSTRPDGHVGMTQLTWQYDGGNGSALGTILQSSILSGTLGAGLLSYRGITGGADGTPTQEQQTLSRREFFQTVGVMGGLGAIAAEPARADTNILEIANFRVERNDDGFALRLTGLVQDALPTSEEYAVLKDGDVVTSFGQGTAGEIPAGYTGDFSVMAESSLSPWKRIEKFINNPPAVTHEFRLDSPASAYDPGSEVTLTTHRFVVDHLRDVGANSTTLSIDGQSIPHESETGDSTAGTYRRKNDRLVYKVGDSPPESQTVTAQLEVGITEETLDDTDRVIP